jgi:hypothetical protein
VQRVLQAVAVVDETLCNLAKKKFNFRIFVAPLRYASRSEQQAATCSRARRCEKTASKINFFLAKTQRSAAAATLRDIAKRVASGLLPRAAGGFREMRPFAIWLKKV